jgi:hypothetical protein
VCQRVDAPEEVTSERAERRHCFDRGGRDDLGISGPDALSRFSMF